ncbi:MAG: hypothetical protein CMO80_09700 [Verrucomicrobiales bacterium]|nr:hypothetical protein [Verrucomicrobiales bacterium]|tara:strand:- start:819 stop:1796 length:978 start_codon:yes stop_codon:yes gene_type:complete
MQDEAKRTYFYYALLATTLVPLLALPFLAARNFPFDQSLLLGLAVFAGGLGHVASTACVYADKSVRELMQPMKLRFYALPIGCVGLTVLASIWGSKFPVTQSVYIGVYIIHLFWLHFHYQKQNYGLVAFVAASQGKRIPKVLSNLLLLPALAGVLAIMPSLTREAMQDDSLMRSQEAWMYKVALAAYIAGVVLIGRLVWTHRAEFSRARTAIIAAVSCLFFLPAVLLNHSNYAFWSYALAHGFQYLLMVFTLTKGPKVSFRAVAAFLVSLIGGGYLLKTLGGNQALLICGILLNWVHFVLDAKLWRMSEPGPRKLIRGRFAFLFD